MKTLEKMLLQAHLDFMNKSMFRDVLHKRIIEWEQVPYNSFKVLILFPRIIAHAVIHILRC